MYPYPTPAQTYGGYHYGPYRTLHVVTVPSAYAPPNVQIDSNICWASAIQMIFEGSGHLMSQGRIVTEVLGRPVNARATDDVILKALNAVRVDDDGRRFVVQTGRRLPNFGEIVRDLSNDFPVIIGTCGHAMVLVRVEWVLTPRGPEVTGAMVSDPDIGCVRWLDPHEWEGITFAACVRITDLDA